MDVRVVRLARCVSYAKSLTCGQTCTFLLLERPELEPAVVTKLFLALVAVVFTLMTAVADQ